MIPLKYAEAGQKVPVALQDETDFATPETGITSPTITISKNGGAFASPSDGTWVELGSGAYTVRLDATDTNTAGWLLVRVVAGGCATSLELYWVHDSSLEVDLINAPNSTAIAAIQNGLATSAAQTTIDTVVDAIKAKTDNLKDSWNDVSTAQVNAEVDTAISDAALATSTEIAAIDTLIDAIKAKTDLLEDSWNNISVADILAGVLVGTYTVQDALLELVAVVMNKLTITGSGPYTLTFRNNADDADLVTLTVAADGTTRTITRS